MGCTYRKMKKERKDVKEKNNIKSTLVLWLHQTNQARKVLKGNLFTCTKLSHVFCLYYVKHVKTLVKSLSFFSDEMYIILIISS